MSFKVAIVGATGNVGREILDVLAERRFPVSEVVALASSRSVGTEVSFGDKVLKCRNLTRERQFFGFQKRQSNGKPLLLPRGDPRSHAHVVDLSLERLLRQVFEFPVDVIKSFAVRGSTGGGSGSTSM